jgi:hypothetical protein
MRRLAPFRQPISKPQSLSREHITAFWNPNHPSVQFAPQWFMKQLHDIDEELSCTWNPIIERWQVFAKAPKLQHPIARGWRLLFIHRDAMGRHLPLDERVLARVYSCSARVYGNGKKYFDHIMSLQEREREQREKQYQQDLIDSAMPSFEHQKIQVSGFGKSSGSKFSTYHQ